MALKRQILQWLRERDTAAIVAELHRPWPGMAGDLANIAVEMVDDWRHGGPGVLFAEDIATGAAGELALPRWMSAASERLIGQYGEGAEYEMRFQKAMAVIFHRLGPLRLAAHTLEDLCGLLREWLPEGAGQHGSRSYH